MDAVVVASLHRQQCGLTDEVCHEGVSWIVVDLLGAGELRNADWLGADVVLRDVRAREPVVVRTRFYPAWRAFVDGREVPLQDRGGQLSFDAPASGSYTVRLEYPRYRGLSILALFALIGGAMALASWPRVNYLAQRQRV